MAMRLSFSLRVCLVEIVVKDGLAASYMIRLLGALEVNVADISIVRRILVDTCFLDAVAVVRSVVVVTIFTTVRKEEIQSEKGHV